MMNGISTYYDAGFKAGKARDHHDEALAQSLTFWLQRAKAIETVEDRKKAQSAFDEGYAHARCGIFPG